MANAVIFNNLVLRDGHQSLAATRMRTEQMLPVLDLLDSMGFGALETWGGATIDAGLRFLDEFPFDRLDALKAGTPNTPHMMLLRGQNIVQYANFPDDVVTAFVHCAAKHGMDRFRIFDALNDVRNIRTAVEATKAAGKHAQGVICYTSSPFHTVEKFIELGESLQEMGCDSICLKDMAGLIPPVIAYKIVKGLKERLSLPVNVHTHDTTGLGGSTYYAAIEAGADMIDTSVAPFANGTAQPDTLRMLSLLEDHPRQPAFDLGKLKQLREYFTKVYHELSEYTAHKNEVVDTEALRYQVPGGMLSNFRNQLKEQKMEDKFEDVFAEIPVVREALGWIPLVTPTSQIVGVQAMLNVKFGRWKNFSPQAMDIALGYYGQTPSAVDPDVQKAAAKKSGKEAITCRPADLAEPRMEKLRRELEKQGLPSDDEHCVIHAMFPQELKKHYDQKKEAPAEPESVTVAKAAEEEERPKTPAPASPSPVSASEDIPEGARKVDLNINGRQYTTYVQEVEE
ncbi:MAG: pyruvate carboxylase subunit B [Verrucomicrobia bacterium]|jgi:oxaloacetate decarboxylase alpha subunit/pyruvate carboxylase subunit B|nr:pyruvate carboxylase subunit B [Verrucomicrobiota bacterium]